MHTDLPILQRERDKIWEWLEDDVGIVSFKRLRGNFKMD